MIFCIANIFLCIYDQGSVTSQVKQQEPNEDNVFLHTSYQHYANRIRKMLMHSTLNLKGEDCL